MIPHVPPHLFQTVASPPYPHPLPPLDLDMTPNWSASCLGDLETVVRQCPFPIQCIGDGWSWVTVPGVEQTNWSVTVMECRHSRHSRSGIPQAFIVDDPLGGTDSEQGGTVDGRNPTHPLPRPHPITPPVFVNSVLFPFHSFPVPI